MLNFILAIITFFIGIHIVKKIVLKKNLRYAKVDAELRYMKSPTQKNKINMLLASQRLDAQLKKDFSQRETGRE